MASKKYIGKTCAYCTREGVSEIPDHVVAREFFLVRDRGNLPIIPACAKCYADKSKLEHYALSIIPLGNRHVDAKEYSAANIKRRLRKNPALRNKLFVEPTGIWERHPNGLLVPTASVAFGQEKFRGLFALIVRGLFAHHWGEVLNPEWQPDVAIITDERAAFPNITNVLGPHFVAASGNL
jgi:hypothetical protein